MVSATAEEIGAAAKVIAAANAKEACFNVLFIVSSICFVLMDDWLDFAKQRSMSIVQSIDLTVRQYMESLHFLTGLRGNELLIREALEEYLNW